MNCYIVSYTYVFTVEKEQSTSMTSFYFETKDTGIKLAKTVIEKINEDLKNRNIKADGFVINAVSNLG